MSRHIAFSLTVLCAALAACREPVLSPEPQAAAQSRLPIKAVVWSFKDETPQSMGRRSTSLKDGSPVFESSLTWAGSAWRPQLSMDVLSKALAAEVEARLTESAEVVEAFGASRPMLEEEAKGARLFLEGSVQEAVWIRSRSGGGNYRLRFVLSATMVRSGASNLERFWTKTVEVEGPHRGRPAQDLAKALRQGFGGAVEDLGKSLAAVTTVSSSS